MIRLATIIAIATTLGANAQQDPGKTTVGQIRVDVYFATNQDASLAGQQAVDAPTAIVERLRKEQRLRFSNYKQLGHDTKPLYRSYENWAEPLKPSDEVMVRFEAQSEPTPQLAVIDLELWLGRKKTIKADARLEAGKPLFVLGPEWRQGHLIIAISFTHSPNP